MALPIGRDPAATSAINPLVFGSGAEYNDWQSAFEGLQRLSRPHDRLRIPPDSKQSEPTLQRHCSSVNMTSGRCLDQGFNSLDAQRRGRPERQQAFDSVRSSVHSTPIGQARQRSSPIMIGKAHTESFQLSNTLPETIVSRAPLRHLQAGELLFRQGDEAYAVFEIEWGRIQLTRHSPDGRSVILYTGYRGDLVAEAALFSPSYHCDAVTVGHSQVRVFRKDRMLAAMRQAPEVAEAVMALLARQVQSLRAQLETRNIRSARERVLHHLSLLASEAGDIVRIEGTLKDLAAVLGLAHEALYRALAELERDGLIQRQGSVVRLKWLV
jgi:CRP/FNR family transcriptional regulator, dissimilatory nitrate respiration regulator